MLKVVISCLISIQVEKMLEKKFGDFLFASLPEKSRACPRYAFAVPSMLRGN